jgi:DNA primase
VLGRSLDELPPQTRPLLLARIAEHVRAQMKAQALPQAEVRFTRKALRELTGWGDTQLRVHLERLVSLEYLLAHRDGAGGRFAYELLFDGDAATAVHLSGLIDAASIDEPADAAPTAAKSRGAQTELAGRLRGDRGVVAAGLRGAEHAANPALARLAGDEVDDTDKPPARRLNGKHPSYAPATLVAAS